MGQFEPFFSAYYIKQDANLTLSNYCIMTLRYLEHVGKTKKKKNLNTIQHLPKPPENRSSAILTYEFVVVDSGFGLAAYTPRIDVIVVGVVGFFGFQREFFQRRSSGRS